MPRLFDLLPDDTKKGLIADAKKNAGDKKAPAVRSREDGGDAGDSGHPRNHPVIKNAAQPPQSARTQPIQIPDFVAIDVETTGLEFKTDRVIEVGAVRFIGGKPEEEFSTFINPGAPVPDYITRLTKITDDDVRSAPRFSDIAARLLEFIGTLPICGHQTDFDLTFINEELKRAAFPEIAPQIIDTALLARVLLQHVGRFSLTHVCGALSVTLDNAHRALYDAKASGEAAVKLMPMIGGLPLDIRRALAAFAPGSMFKTLAVKSLGGTRYGVDLPGGTPLSGRMPKIDISDDYLEIDINQVDRIFSGGGNAGGVIKGFAPRPAQREMARNVAEALNGSGILVAEAGTGTGKSLAYLVPASLYALKNNCRIVVSTHTRNLQDQLINNDLPAAAAMCGGGGELRFTKLKGRGNYLCRNRFYKLLRGEIGNLSARERNAVLPLVVWSQSTVSGDIEEQTFFNIKWFHRVWGLISADSQECAGRRCPYYPSCFLHKARQLAQTSHIVVINHALFYSDVCSETSFLGSIGSIIFDEAHHLESSGHRHLRTELDTSRVNAFADKLQNLLHTAAAYKEFADAREFEKDLKNHLKNIRKRGQNFLHELEKWAQATMPDTGGLDYQIPVNAESLRRLSEPAVFDITLGDLSDCFHRFRQLLSLIQDKDKKEKIEELREEVAACSERASQMRADLQYLIAAKTEDHVFWLEGSHIKKWTKLCGVPLDISELLAQIWRRCGGGIVFTSATLATQKGSTDYFKRAAGLEPFADRTASIILPSPYGADQMLFGAFRNCPEPDSPVFAQFAADVIAAAHSRFGKNILALFTSNTMLNNVYTQLKSRADVDRNNLLAQGISGGSRNTMLDQFKAQSGMILLGTDSFWEGVDAPGEACEIVIIPRLPFPVPTHPLTQALGKRMEELYGNSFFSYSVPEAVIKFRQGTGRLIRAASDRGVLIVLDNRIVAKGYGKQFVQSLESPVSEFGDIEGMIGKMRDFFESPAKLPAGSKQEFEPESTVKYVPFEDL